MRISVDAAVATITLDSPHNRNALSVRLQSELSEHLTTAADDMKVRVYGDVAIVTGRQTLQGTAKGYVSGPRRFTDIFVKRNGRWQCAGGQSTLVAAK